MPGERLENSLALHLVFCQVVQDVYNNGCIRINKEDRIKMRGMLGMYFDRIITPNNGMHHSTGYKLVRRFSLLAETMIFGFLSELLAAKHGFLL